MKLIGKKQAEKASFIHQSFLDNHPSNSRFAESYRTLRTNIQFSFMENTFRSLLVTSAAQEEGKTSTVNNLGLTMARAGKSVLMIDADLRKPMLSRRAVSNESPGLTGLISEIFSTDIKKGFLNRIGPGDLFRLIALQNKTGLLELSNDHEKAEMYFLKGELVDLNWPTRPEEKKLANTLVKNKLLSSENVKAALARQKDTGQKLGFILINMGLLKKDDLKGFLTLHMLEGLRFALLFNDGKFGFKNLPESEFERPSFDPVDFKQLFKQIIIGEEKYPFLQGLINSSVLDTGQENLKILPSGNIPPNPSELLGSRRMSFLLSNLSKRFDRILIDTPPVLPATDALLLAPQVDGVIMVTKAGHMNREMIGSAVDQLKNTDANILGVVLNQVDVQREGYYKYYNKYYSEYYGKTE